MVTWLSCLQAARFHPPSPAVLRTVPPDASTTPDITVTPDATLNGQITDVNFLGSVIRVRVNLGGETIALDTFNNSRTPPPTIGDRTKVTFASNDVLVLH